MHPRAGLSDAGRHRADTVRHNGERPAAQGNRESDSDLVRLSRSQAQGEYGYAGAAGNAEA